MRRSRRWSVRSFGLGMLLGVTVGLFTVSGPAQAVAPLLISYQGQILDPNGLPMGGTVTIRTGIWTASVGGSLLYEEEHSAVPLTNGVFDLQLGTGVYMGGSLSQLDEECFASEERYLQVAIDGEILLPRQRIGSGAYAFQCEVSQTAGEAAYATAADYADDAGYATSAAYAELANNANTAGNADTVDGHHASAFVTSEVDPTVPEYLKNGVSWTEISSRPSGLDDGDQVGITVETDPQVGALSASHIPKWNGTQLINSGTVDMNGKLGIGDTSPSARISIGGTGVSNGISIGDDQASGAAHLYHTSNYLRIDAPGDEIRYGTVEYIRDCGSSCTEIGGGKVYFTHDVGVGTSTPDEKLHVAGNFKVSTGGGSVAVTTPGGWPGVIAYTQNGHRSDIAYKNDGMYLTVGTSSSPPGVYEGIIISPGGNVGLGRIASRRLDVNGNVRVSVVEITGGSDLSESFDIASIEEDLSPAAGMVVSIDAERPGDLVVTREAYDRRVAGIVSGAGGVSPGMLMGQDGSEANGSYPVALTGRVYTYADASFGAIEPGDLLTTSDTPGHAMKVTEYARAQGAIIGKAMTPLRNGKGLVLVLVSLQ